MQSPLFSCQDRVAVPSPSLLSLCAAPFFWKMPLEDTQVFACMLKAWPLSSAPCKPVLCAACIPGTLRRRMKDQKVHNRYGLHRMFKARVDDMKSCVKHNINLWSFFQFILVEWNRFTQDVSVFNLWTTLFLRYTVGLSVSMHTGSPHLHTHFSYSEAQCVAAIAWYKLECLPNFHC